MTVLCFANPDEIPNIGRVLSPGEGFQSTRTHLSPTECLVALNTYRPSKKIAFLLDSVEIWDSSFNDVRSGVAVSRVLYAVEKTAFGANSIPWQTTQPDNS